MKHDVNKGFETHMWESVEPNREEPDRALEPNPDFSRYRLGPPECGLISASPLLKEIVDKLNLVGESGISVLIQGETGTGKELIARVIHRACPRKNAPLVVVDCGSITSTLFESEAFGHKKGSFTGAVMDKVGLLEEAHNGVVFLDEVDTLDAASQAKLLRFLQERQIKRVGENQYRLVDVQVIAASNRDLQQEVNAGRFRRDLFQRLNQFPVHLPALRERPEDIELLVRYFIDQFSRRFEKTITAVEGSVWRALMTYRYEGNIRELQNIIYRAVVFSNDRIDRDGFAGAYQSGDKRTGIPEGKRSVKTQLQYALQQKRQAYGSIDESRKNYSRKYFTQKEIEDVAHALSEFVFRRNFRSAGEADDVFTVHLLEFENKSVLLNSGFSQAHLARYLRVKNTKRHIEILQLLAIVGQVDGPSTRKLEYFVVFNDGLQKALDATTKLSIVQVDTDSVGDLFYAGSRKKIPEKRDHVDPANHVGRRMLTVPQLIKTGIAAAFLMLVGLASYYFGGSDSGKPTTSTLVDQTVHAGPTILINTFFVDPTSGVDPSDIAFDLRALLESRESVSGSVNPFRSGFMMVSHTWQTHEDARRACLESGASLVIWGKVVEDKNNRYLIVRQTFAEENIQTMLGRNLENFNLLVTDQKGPFGNTHYLVTNNRPLPVNLSEKSYVISENYPAAMSQMANDVFELYNLALGISELERGRVVEAESFFEKAYNTMRKVPGAQASMVVDGSGINQRSLICFYRGSVRLMMRDYSTAAEYFSESTGQDSLFADGYCSEGIARYKSGRIDEAIDLFKKAITLEKRAEFYNNIGVAYVSRFQNKMDGFTGGPTESGQTSLPPGLASYVKSKSASEPIFLPRSLASALEAFRKAVTLKPAMMEAKLNLRALSGALFFFEKSISSLETPTGESLIPVDPKALVEILMHLDDDGSSLDQSPDDFLSKDSFLDNSPRRIMISDN